MADTRPWVMPIRAATWAWVMPRRPRISASRKARCSARSCSIPAAMAAFVGRIGIELGEELIAGVEVELAPAHRMFLLFQVGLVTLLGQREAGRYQASLW